MSVRVWIPALALAGCTIAPNNGTPFGGNVIGKPVTFNGYYNEPDALIRLDVLADARADPALAASWVQLTTTHTSNQPTYINAPDDPLYDWSAIATPVPNLAAIARWPQGGLVRIRAVHPDAVAGDTGLVTFDVATYADCVQQQSAENASWATIGNKCAGISTPTLALVSTTNAPVASGGFLKKPTNTDSSAAETSHYYSVTGAPATLDDFKTLYGFGPGNITATYYNDGDLGLGREMHCKGFLSPGGLGIACYVTNYSGVDGVAAFDVAPATVLADAVARQHAFATVAMVYTPPGNQGNAVKFVVYGADGARATQAQLDSTGAHKSIPNNCMTCHGIDSSFNAGTGVVTGARFLPFDPFSYQFSAQAGFTFAAQATALRQLNALVTLTSPTPATLGFITGLYAPKLVTDPTAVANPDLIPTAWATATTDLDATAIYKGLIKVACRTCHISSSAPGLDFAQYSDYAALAPAIRSDVCGTTHVMPHAERVMKKLWASGGRAYLVASTPAGPFPDALAPCKP